MGYRSEVCIAINKEFFDGENDRTLKKHLEDCDSIHLDANDENYFFVFDSVKWYPEHEDVKYIESFIRKFANKACLLRIGEEDHDVERIGDTYNFDLCLERRVDFPKVKVVDDEDFFSPNSIKFIKQEE